MQERKMWIASGLCAMACAACVAVYVAGVQGEASKVRSEALERYGGDQVEVCVAAKDIAAGQTIGASDVQTKMWVAALLPEGAVTDKSQIVGSLVQSTILSGEVVSAKRLGNVDSLLDVPQGMTALSVPARSVQAVGGAISPGQKVDLYATGNTATVQIGQGLLVLATSSSGDVGTSAEISWITLAVEPQSVQELVSAAQASTLYFALPGEAASTSLSAEASSPKNVSSSGGASPQNTNQSR